MNKPYISLSFSLHYKTVPGRCVFICGSPVEFGQWDPSKAFPLQWSPSNQWSGSIKLYPSSSPFHIHYKYIEASSDFSFLRWEEIIPDRTLRFEEFESSILLVLGEVWSFPQQTKRLISIPLDLKLDRDSKKIISEEKDVRKVYNEILSSYVMGSMNVDQHYYTSLYTNKGFSSSENSNKVKRLASEIKVLQSFLPLEFTNSIFVKYDEQRMDVMKALIFGAEGTPYANGGFLFDIFFDENYPLYPPKVTLMTTGGGKVRFNPNLYNNGYVCLSLLGTWSGDSTEKWRQDTSNLLQVLISLQSIVMSEGVIYNEPAYSQGRYSKSYLNLELGYSNIVKLANIKFAMNDMIKNPPKGFEEIVRYHFYLKREEIMKECMKWLNEAEIIKNDHTCNADYGGLVSSHNYELSLLLTKEKGAYYNVMNEEIENLRKTLDGIKI